jgi:hypothetical protein
MNNTPQPPKSPFRAPSPRVTAALAAAMLAIGVAVGAAIGPAPTPSFAVGQLLPSLLGAAAKTARTASGTVQPPAVTPQPTPQAELRSRRKRHRKRGTGAASAAETPSAETETTTSKSTPPKGTPKTKTTPLPPVTKVWLIELDGSSFGEAAAQASAAPYIDTQAVPSGTLLSGFSALDGSALANDATLISSTPPQLLDTIIQPPCPATSPQGEGAAGAGCAPNTPGALSAADEFLKATLPTITATAAYRENGLVVVTFASVATAGATSLPTGAATATLTAQPPAGVLLISPFVTAGAKSSTAFTPTAPKQSLEKLLRR